MWNSYLFAPQLSDLARRAHWQGAMDEGTRQLRAAIAPHDGAGRRRQPVGSSNDLDMPGFPAVFRSRVRTAAVEVVCDPADSRRRADSRPGRTSTRRSTVARTSVECRVRHPEDSPLHHEHAIPRRRTSAPRGEGMANLFTLRNRGGECRYGEDGVVLSNLASRYARLGLGATPVLVDGVFGGRQRKMALTAARNGYFFVVDRLTGEHLLTSKFSASANWAEPALNTGSAGPHSGEGPSHCRCAGVERESRRGQLAASRSARRPVSSTYPLPTPTRCAT